MRQFLKFIFEVNSTCFGQFLCPSSGVFVTVHTAMVYVIQCLLTARKLSANLYDIYHCCGYSEKFLMMDRGTV